MKLPFQAGMTLKEKILLALAETPGLTDTDLERKLGARHQSVNQACRQLALQGKVSRDGRRGTIKNFLAVDAVIPPETARAAPCGKTDTNGLQEDPIKEILDQWLRGEGWETQVAWGRQRGPDIVAKRGSDSWIIEVKGCGSLSAMRVNYFLAVLGETLQRMECPDARYSIALPDMRQFRNLWSRLPKLAKERARIDAIFVSGNGQVIFEK